MGFVGSKFHLNIQFINANFISIHHQLSFKNVFETLQVGTMCRVLVLTLLCRVAKIGVLLVEYL
jgi:hypothetical protein